MLTEPKAIQKLALRSDLPRFKSDGFYLFAQLEPAEQRLARPLKYQRLAEAYAALVAQEERYAERPLPAVLPQAYRERELSEEVVEVEYACALAERFERRNRAGQVLAVTSHLRGRVRLVRGAFAYFAPEDFSPLETLDTAGFTPLEPRAEQSPRT